MSMRIWWVVYVAVSVEDWQKLMKVLSYFRLMDKTMREVPMMLNKHHAHITFEQTNRELDDWTVGPIAEDPDDTTGPEKNLLLAF
jgi:hypothetical protein